MSICFSFSHSFDLFICWTCRHLPWARSLSSVFFFVGKVVVSVSHHFKNKSNASPQKSIPKHQQKQQDTRKNRVKLQSYFLENSSKNPGRKHAQILYNNLGGLGPGHLDEPALLRFEKTCSIDDRAVDLVTWTQVVVVPIQKLKTLLMVQKSGEETTWDV